MAPTYYWETIDFFIQVLKFLVFFVLQKKKSNETLKTIRKNAHKMFVFVCSLLFLSMLLTLYTHTQTQQHTHYTHNTHTYYTQKEKTKTINEVLLSVVRKANKTNKHRSHTNTHKKNIKRNTKGDVSTISVFMQQITVNTK